FLVAISPLGRPEGFGFLLLATIALLANRRWWWLLVLPLPTLLWDYQGWRMYGSEQYSDALALHLPQSLRWILWLKETWPYATQSIYGRGSIFHYAMLMPAVSSPLIFPAMCLGIWLTLRGRIRLRDHLDRCAGLIAIIPLLIP